MLAAGTSLHSLRFQACRSMACKGYASLCREFHQLSFVGCVCHLLCIIMATYERFCAALCSGTPMRDGLLEDFTRNSFFRTSLSACHGALPYRHSSRSTSGPRSTGAHHWAAKPQALAKIRDSRSGLRFEGSQVWAASPKRVRPINHNPKILKQKHQS